MSDYHLRDLRRPSITPTGNDSLKIYPTLCGDIVYWWNLDVSQKTRPPRPLCMGCILVHFQNKAEEDA